jgi:hypothetical protein
MSISDTRSQHKQTTQKDASYLCVIGRGRFYASALESDPTAMGQGLFPITTVSVALG